MCTLSRRFLALVIAASIIILSRPAGAQQGSASSSDSAAESRQPGSQWQNGRQNSRVQNGQPQRRLAAFAQYLNLTDDQKRQFMQIQKETGQSVWAARHDDSLGEEQMQQKIRQIHADQRQKILALLTTDQQELLKKWNAEQKKQVQSQNSGQDQNTNSSTPSSSAGQAKSSDDDFFAGMAQDPDPPAPQQRQTAKGPKNQ